MAVLTYIFAAVIGTSLGLIGAGGSILTVPVLVYMAGVIPILATAFSMCGIFPGTWLDKFIDGSKLKKGFGWLVLVMGIYMIL